MGRNVDASAANVMSRKYLYAIVERFASGAGIALPRQAVRDFSLRSRCSLLSE
jgi:hypothetical protein